MKLLKLAVMASLAFGGAWGADKASAELETGVRGGQHESGKESTEKKFKGALKVNGGTQRAEMKVKAEKDPIIDIATTGKGNDAQWKAPKGKQPSAQSPQAEVTQSATFTSVKDGGYRQKTEGAVQTGEGGTAGDNKFDFDSSIETVYDSNDFIVTIEKVPEYLYAGATAAVPVKFQIIKKNTPLKDQPGYKVDKVGIEFNYDGKQLMTESTAIAPNEGFGDAANGKEVPYANVYTAWIPIEKFKECDVALDTTSNASFKIALQGVSVEENGKLVKISGAMEAGEKRIKQFGDKQVEVVEIGIEKRIPLGKISTRLERFNGNPVKKIQYTSTKSFNEVKNVSTGFPDNLKVDLRIYRDWSLFGQRPYGCICRNSLHGGTVGIAFMTSYGSDQVTVLGMLPGMDLGKDVSAGNITMFHKVKEVHGELSGIIPENGINADYVGIASGAFSALQGVATIIATGGWAAPFEIALGIASAFNSIDWQIPSTGYGMVVKHCTSAKPGQNPVTEDYPLQMLSTNTNIKIRDCENQYNFVNQSANVGEYRNYAVSIDAEICGEARQFKSTDIKCLMELEIEYAPVMIGW